ncbi:hypothetical protein H4R33_002281 [Dimargaris cristalligena]|uniref:MAPEG family-domain-containing protein n=1 Tax=Dimargaris cristalligena TaxID=215637 RepID=A0A4Q0A551_9FUNG|nr:hypothetical protein H4R33_002281 [Dimargaris cristalligena]RKP40370.1 hypothetical protein BJ085DRAFT_37663 [Dimargaris cristalligena]|eukprot:RKP40370.1 hypothetical protein BJ085DRAFT_37663 [Dimargaris cristalligena]
MYTDTHERVQAGCVLAALVLWILTLIPLYLSRRSADKRREGYDHATPRIHYEHLSDTDLRTIGAHSNTMEAFTLFALGVAFNRFGNGHPLVADAICIIFILTRMIYIIMYLLGFTLIRTLFWIGGFLATLTLYILPFAT